MRIQKYLSQSWVCSRRKAEDYIKDWLVKKKLKSCRNRGKYDRKWFNRVW